MQPVERKKSTDKEEKRKNPGMIKGLTREFRRLVGVGGSGRDSDRNAVCLTLPLVASQRGNHTLKALPLLPLEHCLVKPDKCLHRHSTCLKALRD